MTTRLQALETEITHRMEALSTLAALAEQGGEQAPAIALELIHEIETLETEASVEHARSEPQ
jgi:hypothetical protein